MASALEEAENAVSIYAVTTLFIYKTEMQKLTLAASRPHNFMTTQCSFRIVY